MEHATGQRPGRFARGLIAIVLTAAAGVWSASAPISDSVKPTIVVAAKHDTINAGDTTVAKLLAALQSRDAKVDSLVAARKVPSVTKVFEDRYLLAAWIVFGFVLVWIVGVVVYLRWAIGFYSINYGLTDHEWKVLHPEVYAKAGKELEKYQEIRTQIQASTPTSEVVSSGESDAGSSNPPSNDHPVSAPASNPYQGESFGLPPGTIRGILALSAMVAFLLVEALNIFAPTNLEMDFKELITVFEMVIAFYFGAKAIDIFNKRSEIQSRDKVIATVADDVPAPPPSTKNVTNAADSNPPPPSGASVVQMAAVQAPLPSPPPPAELPALPASQSIVRQTNLVENHAESGAALVLSPDTPLARRVLAMTASFETGKGFPDCFAGVSGDFDGQGLSFGALQWCLGQGSLQPLFKKMLDEGHDEALTTLGDARLKALQDMLELPLDKQLAWARSIQFTQRNSAGKRVLVLDAQWRAALVRLGTTDTMIRIQTEQAGIRFQKALANCKEYNCVTERAVALFFDINVQNGRVDVSGVREKILADVAKLSPLLDPTAKEVETLKIVAKRRSEVSNAQWRADVLSRKMAIAEGAGKVHGKTYDLEHSFGIRLEKAVV